MGETKKITTLNDLKQKNNIFWQIRNEAGEAEAELLLYGEIASSSWGDDEVTPKQFAEDLKALGGKDLKLRINSPGGDVFAAQAIYNQLKSYTGNITACIDGMAASAATIITCAADKVVMPRNGIFMIHNPMCIVIDYMDVPKLKKMTDRLTAVKQTIVNVYMKKCKNVAEAKLNKLMDAETWMSADEALAYGFVDEVDTDEQVENFLQGSVAVVNNVSIDMTRFKQPEKLKDILQSKPKEDKDMDDEKTLLDKLRDLLGADNSQQDKKKQPDPVAVERQRMLDLDAMRDGSELVDKIVDIAKKKGNTAEEIREYVDQVKESAAKDKPQQSGIEEIKNLIKDQLASGADKVGLNPTDETNKEADKKAAEVNSLVAAMKNMRGDK